MTEKTLGEIGFLKMWEEDNPQYQFKDCGYEKDWEASAQAIVAAHEARRWRAWDTVPQEVGDDKRLLAYNISDKNTYVIWRTYDGWTDGEVDDDGCYAVWPLDTRVFGHWSPLPAPPQEVDDAA